MDVVCLFNSTAQLLNSFAPLLLDYGSHISFSFRRSLCNCNNAANAKQTNNDNHRSNHQQKTCVVNLSSKLKYFACQEIVAVQFFGRLLVAVAVAIAIATNKLPYNEKQ